MESWVGSFAHDWQLYCAGFLAQNPRRSPFRVDRTLKHHSPRAQVFGTAEELAVLSQSVHVGMRNWWFRECVLQLDCFVKLSMALVA